MCFGKQKTHKPDWMDPLGPVDMYGKPMGEGTEAQRLRSDLYKSYESSFPQAKAAGNEAAKVATQFGNDPIWSTSGRTLTDTAGGQFLAPNPYLQKSIDESRLAADTRLRNASEEARANFEAQQAATRSGFARNGVTFGTGATQGQDAARAAVEAGLARGNQSATAEMNAAEAARLADNYARERALQMQSAIAGPAAMAQRSHELAAIPEMYLRPEMLGGQFVTGLGSGTSGQPMISQQPGAGDYAAQLAKIAALAYATYQTGGATSPALAAEVAKTGTG